MYNNQQVPDMYDGAPPPTEETGFNDPLADFDGSNFNIIQFLADTDTPVDLPQEHNRPQQLRANNAPQLQQQMNAAYHQNQGRLPDSPPITDISGAGSSASPSSNSDSPYSPDNYGQYSVITGGHAAAAQGLILGVHELPNGMLQHDMISQQQLLQRQQQQQQITSPQSFISPYPPSQPTPASLPQVSPPAPKYEPSMRQMQPNYIMNGYNSMDLYNNVLANGSEGSINSQSSEAPINRKRQRLDNLAMVADGARMYASQPNGAMSDAASPVGDCFPDENLNQQMQFTRFREEQWNPLYNINHEQLNQLQMHVVADKGFNYSALDNCFVNQKKNHFQISVHIEACDLMPPKYVKVDGQMKLVKEFKLAFCGVKAEMVTSEIHIKQSQTDRKPVPHDPVLLEIHERRMTKVTVPRLHFSETTMNNQRKHARPNPDQKFFLLLVRLQASTEDGGVALVQAYQSEKVIVRATNPRQFEPPDSDLNWEKNGNTLFCNGQVAIGTDRAMAPLTVNGDIYVSGNVQRPSDRRLKENILPVTSEEAMQRLEKFRIVNYSYKPEIASEWGLDDHNRHRIGVIAQELQEVIPEAVREEGEYLTVDETRVFYDTVVATQELCRLTDNLDHKIDDKVEEISRRLARFAQRKKLLGSMASGLSTESGIGGDNKSFLSYAPSLASVNVKEKGRRRRHCRNPACHKQDLLCSNKLTQGTIVGLVVVMAMCLIAMSALYVLDWHNRNYGRHHHYPDMPLPTEKGPAEGIGYMIFQQDTIPIEQPDVMPLLEESCPHGGCATYCCAEHSKYTIHDKDMIDSIVPIEHKSIEKRSVAQQVLSSGVKIDIPSLNVTIDERYCLEKSCSRKRGRFLLYVPVSAYMPTIPLQLRISVTKGKFVNSCGYIADFHHKFCSVEADPWKAGKTSNPTAMQLNHETFELSVGGFMQSAYRFRVGYSTESCNAAEEAQTTSFDEFNLIFYRACGSHSEPTLSPPF